MADDFVSFQEYLGLNGDEIRRLEEEAIAAAAQAEQEGRGYLDAASSQAVASGGDLSKQFSYSDFMKSRNKLMQATRGRQRSADEAAAASALGFKAPTSANLSRLDEYGRQVETDTATAVDARRQELAQYSARAKAERDAAARRAARGRAADELAAAQRGAVTQSPTRGQTRRVYAGTRLTASPEEDRLNRAREAYAPYANDEEDNGTY